MDNTKLAAEVVKLKQEVAVLRATVAGLLKDHDGNCCPTLTCTCEHERVYGGSTGGWRCPTHGNVYVCKDYEVSFQSDEEIHGRAARGSVAVA